MRHALAAAFVVLSVLGQLGLPPADETPPVAVAVLCFLTGEMASGFNKICFYSCLGSPAAITIGAAQLCPLSINQ